MKYKHLTDRHLINRINYVKRNFIGFEERKKAGLYNMMAEASQRRLNDYRIL